MPRYSEGIKTDVFALNDEQAGQIVGMPRYSEGIKTSMNSNPDRVTVTVT